MWHLLSKARTLSPRVLLLLSQMPQDPASGAARSMRTICEFLAAAGMEVAALATTATEGELDAEPVEHLRHRGEITG